MAVTVAPIQKRLYTVKETAKMLSTSPTVIYKLINNGHMRAMLLPDKKIPDFEIERFMKESMDKGISYETILKEG